MVEGLVSIFKRQKYRITAFAYGHRGEREMGAVRCSYCQMATSTLTQYLNWQGSHLDSG
jgi:hypothetical protein